MKNKKGFTLVELLAVIVLLGVLIAIAVPSVLGISKSIKKKMYEAKVKTIEVAAEAWADDNKSDCESLESMRISQLIASGYLKADDNTGKILNPEDNVDMKNDDISKYVDVSAICEGIPVIADSYNITREAANHVKEAVTQYFSDKSLNNSCLNGKGSNPYLLNDVYGCINNFNTNDFSNLLEDGSNINDYRVNTNSSPYNVYRYQYKYKIDLYKDGKKYSTITHYIDDDNASEIVNISIPSGYKYDTDTCERLYYDDGEFVINTSGSHYTNVACNIYFVPGIATRNY